MSHCSQIMRFQWELKGSVTGDGACRCQVSSRNSFRAGGRYGINRGTVARAQKNHCVCNGAGAVGFLNRS